MSWCPSTDPDSNVSIGSGQPATCGMQLHDIVMLPSFLLPSTI
jgi:hypothetical protein